MLRIWALQWPRPAVLPTRLAIGKPPASTGRNRSKFVVEIAMAERPTDPGFPAPAALVFQLCVVLHSATAKIAAHRMAAVARGPVRHA